MLDLFLAREITFTNKMLSTLGGGVESLGQCGAFLGQVDRSAIQYFDWDVAPLVRCAREGFWTNINTNTIHKYKCAAQGSARHPP